MQRASIEQHLFFAIENNKIKELEGLLTQFITECGPNSINQAINIPDTHFCLTLLCIAAIKGRFDAARILLNRSADANAALLDGTYKGYTPLSLAAGRGHLEVVRLLLDRGADARAALLDGTYKGYTPLSLAAGMGHLEVVSLLLDKGVDARAALLDGARKGQTPFGVAIERGHLEVVSLLLDRGTDARAALLDGTYKGYTPLWIAAGMGHLEVVRLLLDRGADARAALLDGTRKGYTPLWIASEMGYLEVARLLLDRGADARAALLDGDRKGETPFWIAIERGHLEVVRLLLDRGADARTALLDGTRKGETPLSFAAGMGHLELVQLLLDHGADIRKPCMGIRKPCMGKSAQETALANGHTKIAELLNECEALYRGEETKNIAVMAQAIEKIPALAKICLPNRDSLLHAAVKMAVTIQHGEVKLNQVESFIKSLISNHAPTGLYNKDNQLAVDIALTQQLTSIVELLTSDLEKQLNLILLNDSDMVKTVRGLLSGQKALPLNIELAPEIAASITHKMSDGQANHATDALRLIYCEKFSTILSFIDGTPALLSDTTVLKLKKLLESADLEFHQRQQFKLMPNMPFNPIETVGLCNTLINLDRVVCNELAPMQKMYPEKIALSAKTITELSGHHTLFSANASNDNGKRLLSLSSNEKDQGPTAKDRRQS